MTTPSSPGTRPEPSDDETSGGNTDAQPARNNTAPSNAASVSATPVVLDDYDDDDAENYDDELGGRAALDFDAPARGGRRGRAASAPRDLSSLIGEFEAEQERARRGTAPPAPPSRPSQAAASSASETGSGAGAASIADGAEAARLRGELDVERGNLRRAQADLVNARRKAEQERARAVQDATERVIRQFFPLFDDFERGLITTRESRNYDQLASGVEGILRNADALLARYGVQPTESLGKMFDPTLHEAIGVVETTEEPEETVMEELRKGYTLGDRLLRAAMVRVARRPASADAPSSSVDAELSEDTDTELDETVEPGADV